MAYHRIDTWKPRKASRKMLDEAWEHVQSVDYQVSARWVFYRLLQSGTYSKKSDYKTFICVLSRARHQPWGDWRPDTLSDDNREMVRFETMGEHPDINAEDLIDRAAEEAVSEKQYYLEKYENYFYDHELIIDPLYYHDHITTVMFEAASMEQQFRKYTDGITLCPFGGQPSIPFKYSIAKHLEGMYERYEKPLVVLYFGDLDDGGSAIYKAAKEDIQKWCGHPVEFIHCGINLEQVKKYHVPENFDKPGDYQWVALDDKAAQEIITTAIKPYWKADCRQRAYRRKREICQYVNRVVNERMDGDDL